MPRQTAAIAALSFLLAPALATQARGEPLSRAEAVRVALEKNPEVRRAQAEQRRLRGLVREARADALPDVAFLGSALRYRDPSLLNSSSFDAFPAELRDSLRPIPANLFEGMGTLRQTLWSFKLGHAIAAARLGASYGEEDLRRSRQAVALSAMRAYDTYLLALERVRVAENTVRQKERHLEVARHRREAGVVTDLDVLRTQVDLENNRALLLRLGGQAELSRGALNAAMLRPIDAAVEPTDRLEYRPWSVPLDEAVEKAWADRPEARAVVLAERIRDRLVGVARGESRPSLELNGAWGFSVREPSNFFDGDFARWSASVTLRVPVFDGLRTAARVAQARAERDKAAQDRLALENQIRLEAKDAVDRLRVAGSVLEAAELNLTQAQKALEMTEANYRHGAATTLDVVDAQAALAFADSNRVEALFEHASARATLRHVMALDPLEPFRAEPTTGEQP